MRTSDRQRISTLSRKPNKGRHTVLNLIDIHYVMETDSRRAQRVPRLGTVKLTKRQPVKRKLQSAACT